MLPWVADPRPNHVLRLCWRGGAASSPQRGLSISQQGSNLTTAVEKMIDTPAVETNLQRAFVPMFETVFVRNLQPRGRKTNRVQADRNQSIKRKNKTPLPLFLSLSLEIKSRGRKALMMKPQQIRQPEPGLVGVFVSRSGAVGGTPSNRTSEKTQRPDRRPFLARWGTRRGSELVLETRAQDRREEPTRDCPVFKVDLWINYVFKQKHSLDIKNMPPPSGLWSKPWKLERKAHLNSHLHLFWSNVWKLIYAHDKVIKCSR